MDKIGIYPGTFDPMTNGHIDIVKRSLKIVSKLILQLNSAPKNNSTKVCIAIVAILTILLI